MTRQELIRVLRIAELALLEASRISPSALSAHTQVSKALRAVADDGKCAQCGAPLESAGVGRPKTYCGPTCRSAAYRDRGR